MKILAKFIVPLFIFLSSDYLISQFDNPGSYKVKREFGQFSIMRDGVLLATDVYRPKTNDKIPAILLRTPYTRTLETYFLQF